MLYILVHALLDPKRAPPVPYEGRMDRRFFLGVLLALVPPLTLILAVLGSILAGIAIVNQAGAIGATSPSTSSSTTTDNHTHHSSVEPPTSPLSPWKPPERSVPKAVSRHKGLATNSQPLKSAGPDSPPRLRRTLS